MNHRKYSKTESFASTVELIRSLYFVRLCTYLRWVFRHWKFHYTMVDQYVHDFLIEACLGDLLVKANRPVDQLYTYLRTALIRAIRRRPLPLPVMSNSESVPGPPVDCDAAIDPARTQLVLLKALANYRARCWFKRQHLNWQILCEAILIPVCAGTKTPSFHIIAERYGLRSSHVVRNRLVHIRKNLRAELGHILGFKVSDAQSSGKVLWRLLQSLELQDHSLKRSRSHAFVEQLEELITEPYVSGNICLPSGRDDVGPRAA